MARLVEVEDIRQVLETMKRMITGQGLEEESGETGDPCFIVICGKIGADRSGNLVAIYC